jgi:hypothetical protein
MDNDKVNIKAKEFKWRYALILSGITLLSVILFRALNVKKNWKGFLAYMIAGLILAWPWQAYIAAASIPGWWYDPIKTLGMIGNSVIEDWWFYPACGALLYMIRLLIPDIKWKYNNLTNNIFFVIFSIMIFISFTIYLDGGKSISWIFGLPAIIILFYNRDYNFLRFIICIGIFFTLGEGWDIFNRYVNPDWVYISPLGIHSQLWISKMWILGKIPSEITWFIFCGSCCMYQVADIFSERNNYGRQR